MDNERDLETVIHELQYDVAALKAIVVAILGNIANVDREQLDAILDATTIVPVDATVINPRVKAIQLALDKILHDLRNIN